MSRDLDKPPCSSQRSQKSDKLHVISVRAIALKIFGVGEDFFLLINMEKEVKGVTWKFIMNDRICVLIDVWLIIN